MESGSLTSAWTCEHCQRRVPQYVRVCRCGLARVAEPPSGETIQESPRNDSPSWGMVASLAARAAGAGFEKFRRYFIPTGVSFATVFVIALVRAVINTPAARAAVFPPAELTQGALAKIADDANRDLPRLIDSETEALSISALPGKRVLYRYRLVNVLGDRHGLELVNMNDVIDEIRTTTRSEACGNPGFREKLLKRGVTMRFEYGDKYDQNVGAFELKAADCSIQ